MNNFLEKIKTFFEKAKPVGNKICEFLTPVKTFLKKHSELLNPIVVLTAICIIVAAALSLTNSLTAGRIATLAEQNKEHQMQVLIPADDYAEASLAEFEADKNFSFYSAIIENETAGYLVTTTGKGYGGDVVVLTAFNTEGEIINISITSADNETPGIGQNITREGFLSRFAGLNKDAALVKTAPDKDNGEVEAWTGATLSSRAVVNAVNEARKALNTFKALPENSESAEEEKAPSEITEIPEIEAENTEIGGTTNEEL